jgi:hypothetical protein
VSAEVIHRLPRKEEGGAVWRMHTARVVDKSSVNIELDLVLILVTWQVAPQGGVRIFIEVGVAKQDWPYFPHAK